MKMSWRQSVEAARLALESLEASEAGGAALSPDRAFERLEAESRRLRDRRGSMYLAGNGASASLASHAAADLMKNGGLKSFTLTDPALLTAWSNDEAYENSFSGPLSVVLDSGDMLVLISSSGCSENILKAARSAKGRSAFIVTLSGMAADNPLRGLGDLNFYLPARTYGLAESGHALVLHHWIDLLARGRQ